MTNHSGNRITRIVAALESAETFTRAQVADLLSLAFNLDRTTEAAYLAGRDAGYWERVAEENAAYPPPAWIVVQGIRVRGDQAAARAEADADRTQRWAGGTPGEALEQFMWDADRPQPVFSTEPLRVRVVRGVCVWAEA